MTNEVTIPVLPCRSINEMLEFYEALGFEITYQQSRPNAYASVRRGAIELHFFSMREYEPENSYSTCIVLVPDAERLYQEFSEGMRQHYGKRLIAGIPRMNPLREKTGGGRGFNVIDPGGNWIRISQIMAVSDNERASVDDAGKAEGDVAKDEQGATTKLARALHAAQFLAESKGDYAAAAKTLDMALALEAPAPAGQRVQALVARAGLAITMGDPQLARTRLSELRQISLQNGERTSLQDELERATDLERMLE